jgi:anaerobic selenocysteine-containing dehydrogenase
MGQWYKTACALCPQNCGLEVEVNDNRIVQVKGDESNLRSEGYVCRKGMSISKFQHHDERLKYPLKKVGDSFERISWEQAIEEIGTKLKNIIDEHSPRSFAYLGGGGTGCHFEAAFGITLLKSLKSEYFYSTLAQEFSGMFWVDGRMFGKQNIHSEPNVEEADVLLIFGWNGMQSHQIPQAPRHLLGMAKDPDKKLIVVDPRLSETARIADIHLPIRPGTDALLMKAMISIILQEGWESSEYIDKNTSGFDRIKDYFIDFDARSAVETCDLAYDQVVEVCRQFATRKSCFRYDLGLLMSRHSIINSYLALVLQALCGRLGIPGGNVFNGYLMPMGSHSDERDPKTWRTVTTNLPPVMGNFPPIVIPEEILSDDPQRLRAVIVSGVNPLRSYPDTSAFENSFKELELLVTVDISMTETAALSDYVLPARTNYESWNSTFFTFNFPEIFFQMRQPVIKPDGEQLERGEIFVRLADQLGLIPDIPPWLLKASKGDSFGFTMAFITFLRKNPKAARQVTFILAKTLGQKFESAHLSALWAILLSMPKKTRKNAARAGFRQKSMASIIARPDRIARALITAVRYRSIAPLAALMPMIRQSEEIFQALVDHPEGIWIGKVDPDNNLTSVRTEDGKINLVIPEINDELERIDALYEEEDLMGDSEFPFILMAGRHCNVNANSQMRNPAWLKGKRGSTVMMHAHDAEKLKVEDGQFVRVTTEAGSVEIEVEITGMARKGHVVIPHGFGLSYGGKTYGVNINRLTKNSNRDWLGTPLHRYVRCRIEAVR